MTRQSKEEAAQRVKNAWKPNDTLATLAARLNTTRSSIAGIYARNPALKVSNPLAGTRIGTAPPAEPSFAKRNTFEQRAARIEALRTVRNAPAVEVMDAPGQFTLLTLPDNGCRWPHGDRQITFCGHPRKPGASYCQAHHAKAFGGYAVASKRNK